MSLLDTASLIVTPNGYKEGKLYSVIPSDGSGDMSVVRATTATRVNSSGLVELVPYNLLTWSQDFSNATWLTSAGVTLTSGQTDFNGGNTAFRIQMTSASNYLANVFSSISGGVYTHSIYVKSNTGTSQNFRMIDGVTGVSGGVFNGTATTEWQRFQVTITTNSANAAFQLDNNSGAYATDLLICFAQSVEGSVAKDYQKTETRLNIPRLDYSNGTCPSILVEPQRTNFLTYSSSFDNSAWVKSQSSISANATTAPDGTLSADKIIEDTSASGYHQAYQSAITATLGQSYTFSFYAKSAERTEIYALNQIQNLYGVLFDLATGTYSVLSGSPTSVTMDNVGNSWYRCSITGVSTEALLTYSNLIISKNGVQSYAGDGTSGLYIWGAQLEVGSYATSIIPTQGASVTRNADVISKTGISSLIGQTEGTLFAQVSIPNGADDSRVIAIQGGSDRVGISVDGTNVGFFIVDSSGVIYSNVSAITWQPTNKLALAYTSGNTTLYVNGSAVLTTIASFTFGGSIANVYLGQYEFAPGTGQNGQSQSAAALWKTRLTNTQLAQLTTI